MLSPMDDYPLHQVAETIRHAGTSDRNFYDRYYFNMHASSDELFMVMGMAPVVGVPLPLVSYGGTSMLAALIGFGLMMSCSVHNDTKVSR